jgi:hypothetical protein
VAHNPSREGGDELNIAISAQIWNVRRVTQGFGAFDRLWRDGAVSVHSNVPRLDNILGEIGRFEINQQLDQSR